MGACPETGGRGRGISIRQGLLVRPGVTADSRSGALEGQELGLAGKAAGEAVHPAVGTDHTMAGSDEQYRVAGQGLSDGPGGDGALFLAGEVVGRVSFLC